MDQNKFKIIDNFCQKLNDKYFLKHSEIDLFINLKLTGLLNYSNLLTDDESSSIMEKYSKNYKYITEIDSEKNNTKISKNSIHSFSFPIFEIYFNVKLMVNGLSIEPEILTDVLLNQEFDELVLIRYKYKDLTQDAYLFISIYSMQFSKEESLLATTKVNLFDEKFNLQQGKHVFILKKTKEASDNDIKTYENNYIEIDQLINTFSNLKNPDQEYISHYEYKLNSLLNNSENAFLVINFPTFNSTVLYEEEKYSIYKQYYKSLNIKSNSIFQEKLTNWVCDSEIRRGKKILSKDNPITEKFSILSRISDDAFARDIRPSPFEAARIEELLNTPDFIKLEDSDIILFWKYRYHLLNRRYSLTKILNAVKWGDVKSENEFIQNILNKWTEIEICDILYMLSFKFCMNSVYTRNIYPKMIDVRTFAVKNLEKLDTKDINFILLQLVQALRYEDETNSSLRKFLIQCCGKDIELATSLFWFLSVEADDSGVREIKMIETYKNILTEFLYSLPSNIKEQIDSQTVLRDRLIKLAVEVGRGNMKADARKTKLQNILKKETCLEGQLPLDPNMRIIGTNIDACRIFASAKYPIKYTLNTNKDKNYDIMFKYGDDLRQDQLILQIISYMDNLLKSVSLDFKFTTYKVLATSKSDGFVEFVPDCTTIYDILKKNDDKILPYLNENVNNINNIDSLLESFINSCAGYCVVTYILGIGDRHLENLLIDKSGRLFHIDFGYILGKNPASKIYPPPMKLCKQMVECMGGKNSRGYEEFKKKCVDAYILLRNNARIIVNMFYLMIHCGITDLSENSEHVLNKLHQKFVPNLNAQEASNSLLNKIEESVSAFFPYWTEKFHSWANYWK